MESQIKKLLDDEEAMDKFMEDFSLKMEEQEKEYNNYVENHFLNDLNFVTNYCKEDEWIDNEDILYYPENYKGFKDINLFLERIENLAKKKRLFDVEIKNGNPFYHYRIYFSFESKNYCIRVMFRQGTSIQIFRVIPDDTWYNLGMTEKNIVNLDGLKYDQ